MSCNKCWLLIDFFTHQKAYYMCLCNLKQNMQGMKETW
jgi:hypothetical protein